MGITFLSTPQVMPNKNKNVRTRPEPKGPNHKPNHKKPSANMQVMRSHNTHTHTPNTYCVRHANDNEMSNHSAKTDRKPQKKKKIIKLSATDKKKHEKKTDEERANQKKSKKVE